MSQSQNQNQTPEDILDQQLASSMNMLEPLLEATKRYRNIRDMFKREEEKSDPAKVKEFEKYLYPIWADRSIGMKTWPQKMNFIYDHHKIKHSDKGFLMREMAIAVRNIVPKYKDWTILKVMDCVSSWIDKANKLRVTSGNTGSKIHPTEKGHYKFRYHVTYFATDCEKQIASLKGRVQSWEQIEKNRAEEFQELQQKKLEASQPQMVVTTTGTSEQVHPTDPNNDNNDNDDNESTEEESEK